MSFIPQIIRIIQLKSAEEISLWFLIIQVIVNVLLIAYGILLKEKPIYIPSSILFAEKTLIIVLKYYYHRTNQLAQPQDIEMQFNTSTHNLEKKIIGNNNND